MKVLSITKPNLLSNFNLIKTLDIECLIVNGEFIPYAIGFYDGDK
jgi:hypothetical protein